MYKLPERSAALSLGIALTTFGLALAGSAEATPAPQQAPPDFRFAAPNMTFGLRGGWLFASANSDIYDFTTEILTLEKSDFDSPVFAMDFGWKVAKQLDAVLGFEYSGRTRRSEYRDYVDQDGIPIVQDTKLTQTPLTLSLKYYLASRGRAVGQYAWVPTKVLPYVGGGVGYTYYRFEQSGDFVDFLDLTIFTDQFESSGWTFSGHAFAGLDVSLSNSLGFVAEARYQWASADLRGSFIGFEPINLTGLRVTAGVNWKF